MPLEEKQLQERLGRIESLLDEVESAGDPQAGAKTAEIVRNLLEVYGEGLDRMMDAVARQGNEELLEDIAGDDLLAHLLILHGLHPLSVEERVTQALESVRPYLRSHGGGVEFLGIEDGVARLKMEGSCEGCPSSTMTLKLAIEEAIQKAAPDLEGIDAEGVVAEPQQPRTTTAFVAMPTRKKKDPVEDETPWTVVGSLPQLAGGGTLFKEVSGARLLFIRLEDDLYAYGEVCPGCGESMEGCVLAGAELVCPGCSNHYDARRAGRCLDHPKLHLEPVPLLADEDGIVKVALPGVAVG